jgi:hypothetical protein
LSDAILYGPEAAGSSAISRWLIAACAHGGNIRGLKPAVEWVMAIAMAVRDRQEFTARTSSQMACRLRQPA